MKSLRTLTLAATLALIGMAGGYAGDARAQSVVVHERPASVGSQIDNGLLLPAVRTTPGDGVADLVVGAGGGKPGEANGLIGLLRPGEQSGHTAGTLPAVQFPTDQKNGDGRADLVTGAGGGQANGVTKVGPGTLVLNNTNTYGGQTMVNQGVLSLGSLNGVGSSRDLFANSRGGDQATGAHGSGGGGGAGKVVFQDLHATTKAGDGSVMPTDQLTSKGEPKPIALLLPAVQAAREAARRSTSGAGATGGGTAGGGQIATNAVKGVNIQNSARK